MYVEGQTLYGICMENMQLANKRWGVINSDFDVTEDTPVGMFVAVTEGVFIVDGVLDLVTAADYAIAAAHATLERVDSLIYDASAGTIQVVTGTAAAAPNPTALTADQILLALIEVAHTVTTILDANIHVFAQTITLSGNFGDGSDGDTTITSATSITAPKEYNSLTINNGGALNLNADEPMLIMAKEYIWIKSGGALNADYHGGAGGAAQTQGGDGHWGKGGGGGSSYAYGGVTYGGAGGDVPDTYFKDLFESLGLQFAPTAFPLYGSGGGGGGSGAGATGGAGGKGAGMIVLVAPLLIFESGGSIILRGVAGSAGAAGCASHYSGGGGGGGGGGSLAYFRITKTDTGITITQTGGAGGSAGANNGGGSGAAGAAGATGETFDKVCL